MTDRDQILGSLPSREFRALPRSQLPAVRAAPQSDLWVIFQQKLEALEGQVLSPADLRKIDLSSAWVDSDAAVLLSAFGLAPTPQSGKPDLWTAEIGITAADLAIAETGTLLLSSGPGRARLASLAPPVHIALVRNEQIVATLEEAMTRMTDRTTVLITGPSRTADIEGILVRGVHGPGEIWVVPV